MATERSKALFNVRFIKIYYPYYPATFTVISNLFIYDLIYWAAFAASAYFIIKLHLTRSVSSVQLWLKRPPLRSPVIVQQLIRFATSIE